MRWLRGLWCDIVGHDWETQSESSDQGILPMSSVWSSVTIEFMECKRCGEVEL